MKNWDTSCLIKVTSKILFSNYIWLLRNKYLKRSTDRVDHDKVLHVWLFAVPDIVHTSNPSICVCSITGSSKQKMFWLMLFMLILFNIIVRVIKLKNQQISHQVTNKTFVNRISINFQSSFFNNTFFRPTHLVKGFLSKIPKKYKL